MLPHEEPGRVYGEPSIMVRSLHAVARSDLQRLFELLTIPDVYEYLSDGVPPDEEIVERWIATSVDGSPPFGLWLLEDGGDGIGGCARLSEVEDGAASAELTYVVHPSRWGMGLATAMSFSVISRAFDHEGCESILAGADVANTRSVAVMKRLGMRPLREVEYPAGPGVEYVMTRAEWAAMPRHAVIPFADERAAGA